MKYITLKSAVIVRQNVRRAPVEMGKITLLSVVPTMVIHHIPVTLGSVTNTFEDAIVAYGISQVGNTILSTVTKRRC
jgi:hypothetical protein